MKTKLLLTIAVLTLYSLSANAKRYVNITRSGGLFGGYSYVNQTYQGTDSNGDTHYDLTCKNPGFSSCKLHYAPIVVVTPEDEIDAWSEKCFTSLLDEVNTNINNGQTRGDLSRTFQTTLSDNRVVSVTIALKWKPDPSNPEDYSIKGLVHDPQFS